MSKFATFALATLVPALWLTTGGAGRTGQKKLPDPPKAVTSEPQEKAAGPTKAICVMQPLSGSKVHGVIHFTQTGGEVEVTGKITGLTPGLHGFHVHEFGDMTDEKGMSTGAHFNPTGAPHGGLKSKMRHVGDLGNVMADDKGVATIKLRDKMISLHGPHSIIGRGLIVHAKPDDEKSQPSGDAGDRIGGGVIGIANAAPPKK